MAGKGCKLEKLKKSCDEITQFILLNWKSLNG